MRKLASYLLGAGVLSLSLAACPSPIKSATVDNARDKTPPGISVTAPAQYASYSRTLVIDGTVSDLANSGGARGQVSSLSYQIESHTAPKAASIDSAGNFHIVEPTDLKENIVLRFTALDWNGNQSELLLPLTYAGNEIPSFASAEGNRQTTLSWSPVASVSGYTLYMEPSGLTPDPAKSAKFQNITSPYTLTQLKNGTQYSFLLEGDTADGRKNFSSVIRSIPLSTFNLFPRVDQHYNYIGVSWRTYPGIATYEVLRSASIDGPYLSVSGPISASSYNDYGVSQGTTYFYSVRPAMYSAVLSESAEARCDSYASQVDAAIATYSGASYALANSYSSGYLYVADYYYGLRVVDVSQPAVPKTAGGIALSSARDVRIVGNYAYVTHWQSLAIVDISNPMAPSLVGDVAIPAVGSLQAEGLAVLGNLVFVAGFNDGFAVIDASNKASPVVRLYNQGLASGIGQNYSVDAQDRGAGGKVLALAGNVKTALFSIGGTDSSPTVTQLSNTVSGGYYGRFSGTTLYIAGAGGGWSLYAYNTAAPGTPSQLGSGVSPAISVAAAEHVSLAGNRAYVSLRDFGYSVIDISNPASMSVIHNYPVPGHPQGIEVAAGYAFIPAGSGFGVAIYGTGNASLAAVVKTISGLPSSQATITAYRDTAYVGIYSTLKVNAYDLSDPANPVQSAFAGGNYYPYWPAFAGKRAFVASVWSGVSTWDTTTPSVPLEAGYYTTLPGAGMSIALSGNYALVGTASSYLNFVDLSWPGNLIISGAVQTQSNSSYQAVGIAQYGDFAFVANQAGGLRVVDMSTPEFPVALAGYGSAPSAAAVAVIKDCVLVADSTNGLLVFDATNPRSWSIGGQAVIWSAAGAATDVVVRGNYAYVARGASGIAVWDMSNPRSPLAVGTITGLSASRIALYKDYLYAVDGASHLYVVALKP